MNRRFLSILAVLALLLSLVGCTVTPAGTPGVASTEPSGPTPAEIYEQVCQPFLSAKTLSAEVKLQKDITVGGETIRESITQQLQFSQLGTDAFTGQFRSEQTVGNDVAVMSGIFADGVTYYTIGGENYRTASTAQDFTGRFTPVVLLDGSLYSTVTQPNAYTIRFQDATAPEQWALPEGAQFVSASGEAKLTFESELQETSYTVSYIYGPTQVTVTTTMRPKIEQSITVGSFFPEYFKEVDDIAPLEIYETAMLYMKASDCWESGINLSYASQATGCIYTNSLQIASHRSAEDYVADFDQNYSIMAEGYQESNRIKETYIDGILTTAYNDDRPTSQKAQASSVRTVTDNFLSENTYALDTVESITLENLDGIYFLEMQFTPQWGEIFQESIDSTLYTDPESIFGSASSYEAQVLEGYLAVNKYTGFPTGIGYDYAGTHTINGVPCLTNIQLSQSFYLANQGAYKTVTGQVMPLDRPDETAQPLFYRVTGKEGQQMWLLGSIHVGDARTDYLPQEIYDALDSSDALAVEFDVQEYEQDDLPEDEMAQLAQMYIYLDGTTVKDHISPELYGKTVKLLKASGGYSSTLLMMKPVILSQLIDGFNQEQGYGLSSDWGVDTRLLTRAKEKGL